VAKFNPKDFGLPRILPNEDVPKMPALPPPPLVEERRAAAARVIAAWKAHDMVMAASGGDRDLADRAYQKVLNQKE